MAIAPLVENEIVEAVSCGGVDGAVPGEMLPTANRGIDIKRIEFHSATDAADALGCQQRRAAAEKGVEDEIAAGRTIEDRIGDQRDRLYGRVQAARFPSSPFRPKLFRLG